MGLVELISVVIVLGLSYLAGMTLCAFADSIGGTSHKKDITANHDVDFKQAYNIDFSLVDCGI